MNATDPRFDRLQRAYWDSSSTAPRPDCPSSEQLWDAACNRLPAEQLGAIVDHTIRCTDCVEAFRLAREAAREAGQIESLTARSRPGAAKWMSVLAASLGLVALVTLFLRTTDPPAVYRQQDEAVVIATPIADGTTVAREALTLVWSGAPEGSRYTVELLSEQLDLLYVERERSLPSVEVPVETLATLRPGTRLFWRVQALTPSGTHVESPTFSLVLQ